MKRVTQMQNSCLQRASANHGFTTFIKYLVNCLTSHTYIVTNFLHFPFFASQSIQNGRRRSTDGFWVTRRCRLLCVEVTTVAMVFLS